MKYTGSCHCQKVSFEVEMDIENVISCNCSICHKKGHLLAFAPENNFKLLAGEEALDIYTFNKKVIHHMFCKTCGIGPFGRGTMPDGTKMRAINVRCLDGVDLSQIPVQHVDGKNF
ncbi:Glutathione-dependent formaldehyde-activating enzyme [compost metagenome]